MRDLIQSLQKQLSEKVWEGEEGAWYSRYVNHSDVVLFSSTVFLVGFPTDVLERIGFEWFVALYVLFQSHFMNCLLIDFVQFSFISFAE